MSASNIHFRKDLPDVEEYPRKNLANLTKVVQRHIDASSIVQVLGPPAAWALKEDGDIITARLKWVTPEGWEVESRPYFSVIRSRKSVQKHFIAYGPFGDGECIMRSDGFELGAGSHGINELSVDLQNIAYTINEIRQKHPDWNWQKWYGIEQQGQA